ncbi:MAG: zinc-binding dehydrogenase, partial [Gammaproteobacteria bacterium]|nr:zinc-binding dehydrogenase [Gammaproteobacteria bacterium]
RKQDGVLVIGDGKLGQLVALTLGITGCKLTVLGRYARKLEPLKNLGMETLDHAVPTDRSFDVVVECTGNSDGFAMARRVVRPQGTIVLKSSYPGRLQLEAASLVVDEVRILGSRCGPFPKALALLERSALDLPYLVEAVYPLSEALMAFEHSRSRGAFKVLLRVGVA